MDLRGDESYLAATLVATDGPTLLYLALAPAIWERTLQALARLLPQEQIFRVDHFLGMPGVLNLLGLRFANRIIEPVLGRDDVESIEISYDETLGLEGRAAFYDSTGVARDMLQGHLPQTMAVLLMGPPVRFATAEVTGAMDAVLRATHLADPELLGGAAPVLRALYTAGKAGGVTLPDYAAEDGVDPDLGTETFSQLSVTVDTWRWAGVPITLRSGKALGEPRQEIRVTFKRQPLLYDGRGGLGEDVDGDVLRVGFDQSHLELALNVGPRRAGAPCGPSSSPPVSCRRRRPPTPTSRGGCCAGSRGTANALTCDRARVRSSSVAVAQGT